MGRVGNGSMSCVVDGRCVDDWGMVDDWGNRVGDLKNSVECIVKMREVKKFLNVYLVGVSIGCGSWNDVLSVVHWGDGLNHRCSIVHLRSMGVGQRSSMRVAVAVAQRRRRVRQRCVGSMGVSQRCNRRMTVAIGRWSA